MRCGVILLLVLLASCARCPDHGTVIGKWKGPNDDETLIFHPDGRFDILSPTGESIYDKGSVTNVSWEAITEIEPHQLYISVTAKEGLTRVPLGIYKITNDRLVIREAIEYHRRIGAVDMGISRYEMPTDFSGIVRVYKRIR